MGFMCAKIPKRASGFLSILTAICTKRIHRRLDLVSNFMNLLPNNTAESFVSIHSLTVLPPRVSLSSS